MATKCYGRREPYAHKTPLGWALVGKTCFPSAPGGENERILKTTLVDNVNVKSLFPPPAPDVMKCPFEEKPNDEFPGMSQDDHKFLEVMKNGLKITAEGDIQLPVPVKEVKLPCNKTAVFHRSRNVLNRLKQDETKLESCRSSIQKSLDAGHIEELPPHSHPVEGNV